MAGRAEHSRLAGKADALLVFPSQTENTNKTLYEEKRPLCWLLLQMGDVRVLGSRRKGKAMCIVEITDSGTSFSVNSKVLCFIGVSSMQTEKGARLHTEAGPGATRAQPSHPGPRRPAVGSSSLCWHNSRGGGEPSPCTHCPQSLHCPAAAPWGCTGWSSASAAFPEDTGWDAGCSSVRITLRGLLSSVFQG